MQALGLGAYTMSAGIALAFLSFILNLMLAPWMVGSALGNAGLGFIRAIRLVGRDVWWGFLLALATIVPPLVIHYAFAGLAIGAMPVVAWAILAIDSVLVGYLGAIIAATNVAITRRAVARAGAALTVPSTEPGRA